MDVPEAWTWRKKTKGKVDKAKGKVDKIFGNDKGYFEVRLAKLSDGSKVLIGLGKRDAELDKVRSLCMPPLHTAARNRTG